VLQYLSVQAPRLAAYFVFNSISEFSKYYQRLRTRFMFQDMSHCRCDAWNVGVVDLRCDHSNAYGRCMSLHRPESERDRETLCCLSALTTEPESIKQSMTMAQSDCA
jgi:hypothetical protein